MKNKNHLVIAFIMGLGSTLFVATPFGRVAMFDFVCFIIGPILYLKYREKFTKAENRVFLLSLLWFFGTCYTNWWREEPLAVALKGNAIVFNVVCMLIVTMALAKLSHHTYLYFSSGYAFGCVLSLYIFQNGAYLAYAEDAGYLGSGALQEFLVEKQIYPIYANAIVMGLLFPLRCFGFIPWAWLIAGCGITAFLLLFKGGSRSAFVAYLVASLILLCYAYARPFLRQLLKNFILSSIVIGIALVLIYNIYVQLATAGALGEVEYQKYYIEKEFSKAGALGSRDDVARAWPFLKKHPIVGCGSSQFDRWGYMEDNTNIPGHSVIIGAWAQNGILGLIFWCYATWLIVNFMRTRMIMFGDWLPFLAAQLIAMVGNLLFSPFGWFRGMACMTIALCVVAQSKGYMNNVQAEQNRPKVLN